MHWWNAARLFLLIAAVTGVLFWLAD